MSDGEPKKDDPLPLPPGAPPRSDAAAPWLVGLDDPRARVPIDETLSGVLPTKPPADDPTGEGTVDLTLAGEYPSWAELPHLEVSDQTSMIMAFRLPAATTLAPEPPPPPPAAEAPAPPSGLMVLHDTFPELNRLSQSRAELTKELPSDPAKAPSPPASEPQQPPAVEPPTDSPEAPKPVELAAPPAVPLAKKIEFSPTPAPAVPLATAANVEALRPSFAPRGRSVTYGMAINNTSAEPMYQVRIEHELPVGPRFLSADPMPQMLGRRLVWDVGAVDPGVKKRFQITIQPNRLDELSEDTMAVFHVYQCLHSRTRILRPNLSASLMVPAVITVGDNAPLAVEVQNSGSAAANDLRVVIPMPPGLSQPDGPALEFRHPRLSPAGRVRFEADIQAESLGVYSLQAQVIGAGRVLAGAAATVRAVAPELHLRVEGPPDCSLDEPFECHIDVSNLGQGAAGPVRVTALLPDGLDPAASTDGEFDAEKRSLTWELALLQPQESRRFALRVAARRPGDFALRFEAWDDLGHEAAAAKAVTCAAGPPPSDSYLS